jgi:DNA-binding transcriptional LysR family regulator
LASLDQLRTFLAVYRAGTLTAAAQALHLSQPSVSAHLRALEEEIGTPLFVRRARGVEPTARGEALARRIADPLDSLAAVRAGIGAGQVEDTVILGGPVDLISVKALPAIATILSMGLRLRVRTGVAEELVDELASGGLDLTIAARQPHNPEVVYEPLFDETLVLVGAPEWRTRLDTADPAAALADAPWLARDEELMFIRDYCRRVFDFEPTGVALATVPDMRMVARLAAAGAGLTVLPNYIVESELDSGALVELHHPVEPPRRTLALAHRPAVLRRPGVNAVREALLAAGATWGQR